MHYPVLERPLHRRRPRSRPAVTRAPSRRRWGLLVFPVLVGLAIYVLVWRVQDAALENRMRQIGRLDDAGLAHDRVDAFFRGDSTALARGFLSLESGTDDPTRLVSRLKLFEWSLDDDYLLEMKGHHRASPRDESTATAFSLHEWIAHRDRGDWRRRLVALTVAADPKVRQLSQRCLSRIALKVPECLHPTPLPPFATAHLRSLLYKLDSAVHPIADVELRSFALEALLRPQALRVWKESDRSVDEAEKIHLLLVFLSRADETWLDDDLLRALRPHGESLRGQPRTLWIDLLSANPDAAGQGELARLVASASTDVEIGLEILRALKRNGHPRWIDELRAARATRHDGRIVEGLQDTIAALERRRRLLAGEVDEPVLEDVEFLVRMRLPLDLDNGRAKNPGKHIVSWLSGPDTRLRDEALQALARCPVVRGWETAGALLISRLDDQDSSTVRAAARAFEHLTGFSPSSRRGEARQPVEPSEPLPLGDAADPTEVRRFVEAHRRWWDQRKTAGQPIRPEDWYLEGLRKTRSWRSVVAAFALRDRARRPETGAWYARHAGEIRALYSDSEPLARLALIGLLEHCDRSERVESLLEAQLERAFRERALVECWEILGALHRRATGRAPDPQRTSEVIGFFVEFLSRNRGAAPHLALLDRYLTTRFTADEVDRVVGRWLTGLAGERRAQLLRFYPHRPSRSKLRSLLDALSDEEFWCRFWASRRLEELANDSTFGFDPEESPDTPENVLARQRWRAWIESWSP